MIFQLDPLDTGAEAFALTAPSGRPRKAVCCHVRPGYAFVHPCRVPFEENATKNHDAMRCMPLPPLNSRQRARVDCEA